jgi:hypothetical protein
MMMEPVNQLDTLHWIAATLAPILLMLVFIWNELRHIYLVLLDIKHHDTREKTR